MKIENRLVYIAEDGQEFNSEDVCKQYEKNKEFSYVLQTCIEKYSEDYYDPDIRMDIAKAIAEHFEELIEQYNDL